MAKPEWGTKRNCPKCGTRFYDLGRDDPVVCIDCGHEWVPEPILKSKQPIPQEAAPKKAIETKTEDDPEEVVVADDDLEVAADDLDVIEEDDDVAAVVPGAVEEE